MSAQVPTAMYSVVIPPAAPKRSIKLAIMEPTPATYINFDSAGLLCSQAFISDRWHRWQNDVSVSVSVSVSLPDLVPVSSSGKSIPISMRPLDFRQQVGIGSLL